MLRRYSVNFALISICLDVVIITLSLATAVYFRPALSSLSFAKYIPAPTPFAWLLYLVVPFTWVLILLLFSVYDGRKNLKFIDELASLTIGSVIATVSIAGMLYLSYRDVSRLLFITFILLAYILMVAWRFTTRLISQDPRNRLARRRNVLIIGSGEAGQDLAEIIQSNPGYGLQFAGLLLNAPDEKVKTELILGTLDQAEAIIQAYHIEDVVIAWPDSSQEQMNLLVGNLHRLPVKTWIIPNYFRLALHKAAIEDFAGIPMLDLRAPALTENQRLIKRAFDLILTILMLPICGIIMGAIALLIFREDKGPILFKQKRVGENGKLFEMYKFRTMVPGAETLQDQVGYSDEDGHYIHKTNSDPRVTDTGRLLRRWSLDELPQLINILRNEMSLVGPRPELPELVKNYEAWQLQRFAIPQGLTGWWQIHGRSDKPMHLHTEDDLFYIHNYSLLLDIQILARTIGSVARGKGAF